MVARVKRGDKVVGDLIRIPAARRGGRRGEMTESHEVQHAGRVIGAVSLVGLLARLCAAAEQSEPEFPMDYTVKENLALGSLGATGIL